MNPDNRDEKLEIAWQKVQRVELHARSVARAVLLGKIRSKSGWADELTYLAMVLFKLAVVYMGLAIAAFAAMNGAMGAENVAPEAWIIAKSAAKSFLLFTIAAWLPFGGVEAYGRHSPFFNAYRTAYMKAKNEGPDLEG